MPKLGAGQTPPRTASCSPAPPSTSFRLLCAGAANQSAVAICIKISRPPWNVPCSRRQLRPSRRPPSSRQHPPPNIHPPLPQFSTISCTPPLDARIGYPTVRQRDQHPVPGKVRLTIELPHPKARAAHPPFHQAEEAADRLSSYISPLPPGLLARNITLDSSPTSPQPPP